MSLSPFSTRCTSALEAGRSPEARDRVDLEAALDLFIDRAPPPPPPPPPTPPPPPPPPLDGEVIARKAFVTVRQ